MDDFSIGHTFSGEYPPEAAMWCGSNNAMIVALGDGTYEIQAVPTLTTDQKMTALRATRDTLIVATNWLVERHRDEQDAVKTTTLTTAQYATLLTYRQALRDVPAQSGAPDTVTWPTVPDFMTA